MVEYCKRDVELLEPVYVRLAQFMPAKTHVGVLGGNDKWTCPVDGSTDVAMNKKKITASGTTFYIMQCRACGKYYQINAKAYKDYQAWLKAKKEKKQ